MALMIEAISVPLVEGSDGVVRVGGTRVPLETVVHAFRNGATAEEIVQQYPVLRLDDIYAVVSYYLRHRDAVNAYVEAGRLEAEQVKAWSEEQFPSDGIRARLLARRSQRSAGADAPPGC